MAPCLNISIRGSRVLLAVHLQDIESCRNDVSWVWPAYGCDQGMKTV